MDIINWSLKCIPLPLRCVFMFYSGGKRSLSDHRPLPRCTLLESFQRQACNFALIGLVKKGVFFWAVPWGRVLGQTGSGHTLAWCAALALLQLCFHVWSFTRLMPCPVLRQSFGAEFPWAWSQVLCSCWSIICTWVSLNVSAWDGDVCLAFGSSRLPWTGVGMDEYVGQLLQATSCSSRQCTSTRVMKMSSWSSSNQHSVVQPSVRLSACVLRGWQNPWCPAVVPAGGRPQWLWSSLSASSVQKCPLLKGRQCVLPSAAAPTAARLSPCTVGQ